MTKKLSGVGEAKGTTGIPKPEIGIDTIRWKQGIVTVRILHTLEILEFEGDKARIKTLTTLVLTRARVRSKKNLLCDNYLSNYKIVFVQTRLQPEKGSYGR